MCIDPEVAMSASASASKLHRFSLGFSADGRLCRMVFVDDQDHLVECLTDFNEFTDFVSRLCDAATEMAKRQTPEQSDGQQPPAGVAVAAASFCPDVATGLIRGDLVTDTGDTFAVQLDPSLAARVARDLVLALPAGAAN
jgi:hypothetical protein